MRAAFHHIVYLLRGVQVFALVGKSGTGKSFRAKLIAQKYGIEFIIDDGLLIQDSKILAGKSAKKEQAFLGAIKTALFDDYEHRKDVKEYLNKHRFKRILLIGTSERMVRKIATILDLPSPSKIIQIEEVATSEEIERAVHARTMEGKHVIPVPALEIKRNYPHIFADSIKVFLKKRLGLKKRAKIFEKAVVRPEFSKKGVVSISETALTQMVYHCADEFDHTIKIDKVTVRSDQQGYRLEVRIVIPFGTQLSGNIHALQEYIIENIQRYTGILIYEVNIRIQNLSRGSEPPQQSSN